MATRRRNQKVEQLPKKTNLDANQKDTGYSHLKVTHQMRILNIKYIYFGFYSFTSMGFCGRSSSLIPGKSKSRPEGRLLSIFSADGFIRKGCARTARRF